MIHSRQLFTLISIIILGVTIKSCTVPSSIQRTFTIRYDGKKSNLDSLINIRGYYTIPIPTTYPLNSKPFSKKDTIVHDTSYMNYLFFDDGIFLCYMYCKDCNKPSCMPEKLKEYANDANAKKNNYFGGDWGAYIVKEDTIRTQFIRKIDLRKPDWEAVEIDFKIINKSTIVEVNSRPLFPLTKTIIEHNKRNNMNRIYRTASFIPASIIPSSDCWLKKEKWFLKMTQ